jgi:vitamin B12 transporter
MFLVFLFLFPLALFADELEPIDVRATKDASAYHFGAKTVIDASELETRSLLSPVLDQTPGIVSTQNGGPGGRVTYFIRGTESRHVSYTIDNLKLNDSSNIDRQFDAAFLTSPFLHGITVYKGPQAVLFGSDALGGLVAMTSRKGEQAPEARSQLSAGSFGTVSASLAKDWKNDSSQGTLTATKLRTDGISRLNKKRFGATERDGADMTQVTSSSTSDWNPLWSTDLLFSFLRGENELDGGITDNAKDHGISDQLLVQQKTSKKVSKRSALSLRNGLNRHRRYLVTESQGVNSFSGNLIQNELLFKHERDHLLVTSGVASEKESLHQQNLQKDFELHSMFTQAVLKKSSFSFQGGGRLEQHSRYGSFSTGSVGASYEHKSHKFSIQYSQGFKAPSLYQLYAPPLFGGPIGNVDLVPERNKSLELLWNSKIKNLESEISLFQNRLSNLITYSFVDGYINQGAFIAEGVEVNEKLSFRRAALTANFTHQRFRRNETIVLRRPQNLGQVMVSVFPTDRLEGFLKCRWFDSRRDINPTDLNGSTVKLNGFSVLNLGATYRWEKDELGVEIINLTDRDYEELYGYSVMPRSVFSQWSHKF